MTSVDSTILADMLMVNHCHYENDPKAVAVLSKPNFHHYLNLNIKNIYFVPLVETVKVINKLRQQKQDYKKLLAQVAYHKNNSSACKIDKSQFRSILHLMHSEIILTLKRYWTHVLPTFKDFIFSLHHLHPDIFFLKNNSSIMERILTNRISDDDEIIELLSSLYKLLDEHIKDKTRYSFPLKAKKNYQQLSNYTKQLFMLHNNLTVVHMDLFIQTDNDWNFNDKPRSSIHYEDINRYKTQLINSIASSHLKDSLAGYAWKIDHNDIKGFFFHLLLFFNITLPSKEQELAKELNTLWCENITHQQAGVVSSIIQTDNKAITSNLQFIIDMMTRLDHYLCLHMPTTMKTFGRGRVTHKGRERLKQNTQSQPILNAGSSLMALPSKPLKKLSILPTDYLKQTLACQFIEQCNFKGSHLKTIDDLDKYEVSTSAIADITEPAFIKHLVTTLVNITELTRILIKDNTQHYQWLTTPCNGYSLFSTEQGNELYSLLCQDFKSIQEALKGLSTNPLLTLFFKTFNQWQQNHSITEKMPKDEVLYQRLDIFLTQLRGDALNHDNKHSTLTNNYAHNNAVDKNYHSLKNHINKIRKKYASLLVLHLELGGYTPSFLPSLGIAFTQLDHQIYAMVKNCRQLFFKAVKKYYGNTLVGFAWKLKYSKVKGFYHEWLLLLSTNSSDHYSTSAQLQKIWDNITGTQKSFHYWYCQFNKSTKDKSKEPRRSFKEQNKWLTFMLYSLTKTDEYVYFDPKSINSQCTDRIFNRSHR